MIQSNKLCVPIIFVFIYNWDCKNEFVTCVCAAKCIIISIALALFYWFAPHRNKYVLLFILYFTYLLIAYYDHYYDCGRGQFGPTFLRTYYEWAKPKNSKQSIE